MYATGIYDTRPWILGMPCHWHLDTRTMCLLLGVEPVMRVSFLRVLFLFMVFKGSQKAATHFLEASLNQDTEERQLGFLLISKLNLEMWCSGHWLRLGQGEAVCLEFSGRISGSDGERVGEVVGPNPKGPTWHSS